MPRTPKQHFQPRFETLEPRQMLSITGPPDILGTLGLSLEPIAPIVVVPGDLGFTPITPQSEENFSQVHLPPTPTPELPQLQRSVTLAISGDGFFIVQDRWGRQRYTRDGQFQLNNDNRLVTKRGDQLMGYLAENGLLQEGLVSLRIPANDGAVSQETTNVYFSGNLTPSAAVANVPGVIQSQVLVTDEFEIPNDSQFTTANIQVETQPAGNSQDSLGQASYSYYVTFSNSDGVPSESRPTHSVGPLAVTQPDRRIRIDGIPQPTEGYDRINIYRNTSGDQSEFYRVAQIPAGQSIYLDHAPDATILGNPVLDLHGTKINRATRLLNVQARNGQGFSDLFGPGPGTISFTPQRGNRSLEAKTLAVDSTTTVQDLLTFIEEASGIEGSVSTSQISDVVDGRIQITSNLGIENFVQIGLASTIYTPTSTGIAQHVPLAFAALQAPNGEGTTTEFIVYDSLGTPFTVRLTTALVQRTGTSTVYRWYATSPDNRPSVGVDTTIGTGLLTFNAFGDLESGGNRTIAIQRSSTASPLEIQLDFSQVSGIFSVRNNLGNSNSSIFATRQDGFPPGTLDDYAILATGEIRGVFSNGLDQVLGQIPLATIPDPFALRQVAPRLYAQTSASGVPKISQATSETQPSLLTRLPPGYYVARDGYLTQDRSYKPTESTLAAASPTSLRYPWIVRSTRLKIDGRGFFAVEGRNGKTQFTRDGRLHLNRDQELVTKTDLRVLGYAVDEDFVIDQSRLQPLSVPLGSFGHKATEKIEIKGSLTPPFETAALPAIVESVMLNSDLSADTKLVDVVVQSVFGTRTPFQVGKLTLFGRGFSLNERVLPKTLQISSVTTVGDWMAFLEQALGIDKSIPGQQDAGAEIVGGKIRITFYTDINYRLRSALSNITITPPESSISYGMTLPFQQIQTFKMKETINADGTRTEFIAYDRLGQLFEVRINTFFEAKDANTVTYRWIATSPDTQSPDSERTVVGSGLLVFSSDGTLMQGTLGEILVERPDGDASPLAVQLDFSQVTGKTVLGHSGLPSSSLNFLRQDGFPPGVLQKFDIAANGEILGTFSNGMVRPLGQVLLAKFPRPWALRYSGNQLFKPTFRSGRPRLVEPGTAETGKLLTLPSTPPYHHPRHGQGHRFSHHRDQISGFSDIPNAVSDAGDWHLPRLLRKLASNSWRHRA